ncbi:MAG TPA: hypothetical protein VOB72_07070 [Candidatus Dormibacteraeota bacterium]|nr:hypothetical protein [Candidatus Dormibacteraeota bacterium]
MESKIVELRERSERRMRRAKRTALIVGGAGAAVGVALIGAFVVYRLTRPVSGRERARRLLPPGLAGLAGGLRGARDRVGGRVPPMRLYIGDRQVGEEQPVTRWERIAVRAAQAAGTAAAGAIASRMMAGVSDALRSRGGSPGGDAAGRT